MRERLFKETSRDFEKRTYWNIAQNKVFIYKSDIEKETVGCMPEEIVPIIVAKEYLEKLKKHELNNLDPTELSRHDSSE